MKAENNRRQHFGRISILKLDVHKIMNIKGFLDEDEARRLYDLALEASRIGPCLEIGSYCGKSAVFLGTACCESASILYSLDHHTGSEEQQPGQEYFDPELYDPETGKIDTLKFFRRALSEFGLNDTVVPIIGRSDIIGRFWNTPLGLLFIDGSHAYESVLTDYSSGQSTFCPAAIWSSTIFSRIQKMAVRPRGAFIRKRLNRGNTRSCRFSNRWAC